VQHERSLLHYLADRRNTNMTMLRLLLAPPSTAIKPEVDALNSLKETPLAAAMAWGNFSASRELLAAGASLLPAGTSRAPLGKLADYLSSGSAPGARPRRSCSAGSLLVLKDLSPPQGLDQCRLGRGARAGGGAAGRNRVAGGGSQRGHLRAGTGAPLTQSNFGSLLPPFWHSP
jgi:hypothetical protein